MWLLELIVLIPIKHLVGEIKPLVQTNALEPVFVCLWEVAKLSGFSEVAQTWVMLRRFSVRLLRSGFFLKFSDELCRVFFFWVNAAFQAFPGGTLGVGGPNRSRFPWGTLK